MPTYDYFPFDSGLGANSTESRWREMMRKFKGTGIVVEGSRMDASADNCAVSAGSGMQVIIVPGKAWVRGHFFSHTGTDATLAINSNTSGSTRTDLVVIRADFVNNTIQYQVLQGTTTPVQNANTWDLPLCNVAVPNNASSASSFTFTDRRVFAAQNATVPSIKRFNSGLSIPNNAYTSLNLSGGFNWQTFDPMYPGTDPTKIIITQDGYYNVYGRAQFAGHTTAASRGIRILGNGSDVWSINQIFVSTSAADMSCSGIARLFAGDYLQLQGFHNVGSGINIAVNVAELAVHFQSPVSVS